MKDISLADPGRSRANIFQPQAHIVLLERLGHLAQARGMLTKILQVRQRVMARHQPGRSAAHPGALKAGGEFGQVFEPLSEPGVISAKFHRQPSRPKHNAFGLSGRT